MPENRTLTTLSEIIHTGVDRPMYCFSDVPTFKPLAELNNTEQKHVRIIHSILRNQNIDWRQIKFPNPYGADYDTKLLTVCNTLSHSINATPPEIAAALSYKLALLTIRENPLLREAFSPTQLESVEILVEKRNEEVEKSKDERLVPSLIVHLNRVFGFELSVPLLFRYQNSLPTSYRLTQIGNAPYHVVNQTTGYPIDARSLGISGNEDQIEFTYRFMGLVHEVCHAYTVEILNPRVNPHLVIHQSDTLAGVVEEGISKLGETEFLLSIVDHLRVVAPDFAKVCVALLRKEMKYDQDNHYKKGFDAFRMLRKYDFRQVVHLLRNVGFKELSRHKIGSFEYNQFIQDPIVWLQRHQV